QQVGGDPEALVEHLLGDVGGLEKILTDLAERALDGLPLAIPAELQSTLASFRSLVGAAPSDPAHLAGIIAQTLIGLDLDALHAPGRLLTDLVGRIETAGGDFAPVTGGMATLSAQLRRGSALMLAQEPDLDAIEAELTRAKGGLD